MKIYQDMATTSGEEMQRQFCRELRQLYALVTTDHNTSFVIILILMGRMGSGGNGRCQPGHECIVTNCAQDW